MLDDFEKKNPSQFMTKQQIEQEFKKEPDFSESYLTETINYLKEEYLIDYQLLANYFDYRVRITEKGQGFLQGKFMLRKNDKIHFKRENRDFIIRLRWTILKIIIVLAILILFSIFTYQINSGKFRNLLPAKFQQGYDQPDDLPQPDE